MANSSTAHAYAFDTHPAIREIGLSDLRDALRMGYGDFKVMPTHVIFIGLLYPIIGLMLGRVASGYAWFPLIYPLMVGFAFIGPFAALVLSELSRRRERSLETSAVPAFLGLSFDVLRPALFFGMVLIAVYLLWLIAALGIYETSFGNAQPVSLRAFVQDVFFTPAGWNLILVGNGVGFLFAALVFTISVVSFPMILDRHVSAVSAMQTSVRVVLTNPGTMAVWAMVVAAGLFLGSLPLLFGLAIVVPVFGHTSWHLYRKAVIR